MDAERMRFGLAVMPHLDAAYRLRTGSPARRQTLSSVSTRTAPRAAGSKGCAGRTRQGVAPAIVRGCHATAHRQEKRRGAVPLPEEGDVEGGHAMKLQAT